LFAGKGGVGKTTLASATAFRLAEEYRDREVFLISTDPAHSLSDCLGVKVSSRGTAVGPRLTAMEIDAEVEFEALRRQYADDVATFFDRLLAEPRMVDLEFERDVLERILDLSPPGLDELMAVARVVALLEPPGRRLLVVDTAPTGHLVRLLEMPALVQDWLQVMFGLFLKYKNLFRLPKVTEFLVGLSKKIHLLRALLASPEKGQLLAVSILTQMAFEETRDLLEFCRRAGVHVPALFLNQATPDSECGVCRSLFQAESAVRARFKTVFNQVHQCLVYRCGELRGADRLAELGRALYEA
jgi:arsenite-transporting ATPase